MEIEKEQMDIDNFIKERLALIKRGDFDVEPSANFCKLTMEKIYHIEKRKGILITYGIATSVAVAPAGVKYIWLLIRNDYFSANNMPLGNYLIPFYQFVISMAGSFILLAVGIAGSVFFIRKQQHQQQSTAKTKLA